MRIYLLSVLRVANADILPFDWRATTAEFKATIRQYEKQGQGLFDLSPAMAATQELDDALSRFHDALAKGSLAADKANEVLASPCPHFRADQLHPRSALPP